MFRLAVLCVLVVSVYSLSCPCWDEEDPTKHCPPRPTSCPLGYTTDPCGCCPLCYKVEGEGCGGPWQVGGVCGEGLRCEKGVDSDPDDYMYANHMAGVCEPI
uniref:Putative venom gland protein n=1 Tax=Megacormus gertschi TaxID=1843536 RepID=A0A224X881_9SCOR